MRNDALGLFWEDRPPEKKPKAEVIKRQPPEPIWLRDDYLPGLQEAITFNVPVMTDDDLITSCANRERLVFDIETYSNYFIASFKSVVTGKVIFFEMTKNHPLNIPKLKWVLENFTTVGFYSSNYDLTVTQIALCGYDNAALKKASNMLIEEQMRPADVLKQFKIKKGKYDHIDLIEVAPLSANLKIYGGRLHTPKMQDLPFEPSKELSPEQIAITRWYNINADLTATTYLHDCLSAHLDLRYNMSNEEGIDLRSKSDAQIAEEVIRQEYRRVTGQRPQVPTIQPGTTYKYQAPHFLKFSTPLLNWAFDTIRNADFVVGESGSITLPEQVKQLRLDINGSVYQIGIGGLHSTESCAAHHKKDGYILKDVDVTSFYPFIILNLGLYPQHLGPVFLQIYRNIVDRRVQAKAAGNKVIANSLKIVINGSYGKFGSMYSCLYSPNLIIQTTLTGQLVLLMLIERLELAGIHVVSANTDGIVIKPHESQEELCNAIIKQWEQDTALQTEETYYEALYSRDVNNYIAVKSKGGVKLKGAYANPWWNGDDPGFKLHKNPTNTICIRAACEYLTSHTPVETTIQASRNIEEFVSVRSVKGGAVKVWSKDNIEFLGKSIRWYYAENIEGEIVYAKSGNKVPRSDGAKPCLQFPEEFPTDINYDWYINETYKILKEIGAISND
jgi:hypothetical protein